MTLQVSGQISIQDINLELGRVATAAFSWDGADERALAGGFSIGTSYSISEFYGKSSGETVVLTVGSGPNAGRTAYGKGSSWGTIDSLTGSIGGTSYTVTELYLLESNGSYEIRVTLNGDTTTTLPTLNVADTTVDDSLALTGNYSSSFFITIYNRVITSGEGAAWQVAKDMHDNMVAQLGNQATYILT